MSLQGEIAEDALCERLLAHIEKLRGVAAYRLPIAHYRPYCRALDDVALAVRYVCNAPGLTAQEAAQAAFGPGKYEVGAGEIRGYVKVVVDGRLPDDAVVLSSGPTTLPSTCSTIGNSTVLAPA